MHNKEVSETTFRAAFGSTPKFYFISGVKYMGSVMEDDEFIEERVAALEESIAYFGSENKPERERWVVQAFLENMNIQYAEGDVVSPDEDPPDVIALGGYFEVKEILDSGRKRHKEYKDELERVKQVTYPQDLLTSFRPQDLSITEIYQLCLSETKISIRNTHPATVNQWISFST